MRRKCGKVRKSDRKKLPLNIRARQPVPLDPTKHCLAQFPGELLLLILEPLPVEDLLRVALVSSRFYDHARDVQFYEVCIDLSDRRQHVLRYLDLVWRRCRVPVIRSLTIKGHLRDETAEAEGDEIIWRVETMLSDMFDLRDLHWGCGTEPRRCRFRAQDFLARLEGNPNLRTLVAGVLRGKGGDRDGILRGLKGLLTSCPNLTSFSGADYDDQLHRGPRTFAVGLGLVAGERPAAPLEELGLETYEWASLGSYRDGVSWYPWDLERRECRYWADHFDWSRLTVLRGVNDHTAQFLVPKLTNLRRLEVGVSHMYVCERDVLAQVCSPLEALSLTAYTEVIESPGDPTGPHYERCFRPSGVLRFGATLRELTLLEPISNPSLHELSLGLPRLETLALLGHHAGVNNPAFDPVNTDRGRTLVEAVAGFPSLRSLELRTVQKAQPPASSIYAADPPVAADVARAMFAHLRARNGRVRRLLLHSGSHQKSRMDGKMCTHFIHLECRLAYEACAGGSGSGSGSGSGDGNGDEDEDNCRDGSYVSVSSPDLGSAQNLELIRLARLPPKDRPTRLVAELDEREMLVKAALEGAQVREDWDSVQRRKAIQARIASKYSQQVENERKEESLLESGQQLTREPE
ncbi:hypothetical protein PG984_008441 [Apiospora sp. TS-2023a]